MRDHGPQSIYHNKSEADVEHEKRMIKDKKIIRANASKPSGMNAAVVQKLFLPITKGEKRNKPPSPTKDAKRAKVTGNNPFAVAICARFLKLLLT